MKTIIILVRYENWNLIGCSKLITSVKIFDKKFTHNVLIVGPSFYAVWLNYKYYQY